jgi:hypothetical protein
METRSIDTRAKLNQHFSRKGWRIDKHCVEAFDLGYVARVPGRVCIGNIDKQLIFE